MCFAEVRAGSRELRRDDEELREEPERQAVTTRVCRASGEMTFLHPLGTARALVGCSHRQDQAGRREYPDLPWPAVWSPASVRHGLSPASSKGAQVK